MLTMTLEDAADMHQLLQLKLASASRGASPCIFFTGLLHWLARDTKELSRGNLIYCFANWAPMTLKASQRERFCEFAPAGRGFYRPRSGWQCTWRHCARQDDERQDRSAMPFGRVSRQWHLKAVAMTSLGAPLVVNVDPSSIFSVPFSQHVTRAIAGLLICGCATRLLREDS